MTEPRRLQRYELVAELGRGGFAVVHRARDTVLERTVALKVLHPHWANDAEFGPRFRREALAAARLYHPHIVTIYDAGESEGNFYIAMAYLPGRTLAAILDKVGQMEAQRAIVLLSQVAAALDYIHAQGLVHRDVKPQNVMVEQAGGYEWATLMDLGLVKVAAEESNLTGTGTLLGSVEYMAPEQADQERRNEVGPATDQYALAVMAYRAFTGQVPFPGNSLATLNAHLTKEVQPPRSLRPDLPPGIDEVLLRALSKQPRRRYDSCTAFVNALRGVWAAAQQEAQQAEVRQLRQEIARLQAELEQASTSSVYRSPQDDKEMVLVPGGPFALGADAHQAELPAFWIDRTPVTNEEYARFVQDTKSKPPAHWKGKTPPPEIATHPVTHVSWNDAAKFAQWAGKELPSAEQWEKAARGTDGRLYPWGDQEPTSELCNFGRHERGTTPVGQYSPQGDSPYGCSDMAGNVWEWTATEAKRTNKMILCGGSWSIGASSVRVTSRRRYGPLERNDHAGFRCVKNRG